MKKIFFVLGMLFTAAVLPAQKYGHLNFGNLIASMKETKDADTQLEVFQKGLIADGETKAKAFQEKYTQFAKDVQSGTLSPLQQQERQKALQTEQQVLVGLEQEISQKVQAKREELLNPILERAEKAIAELAKEQGYVMVFDTSSFNAILFAQDSDDLMAAVKAKLGIQ